MSMGKQKWPFIFIYPSEGILIFNKMSWVLISTASASHTHYVSSCSYIRGTPHQSWQLCPEHCSSNMKVGQYKKISFLIITNYFFSFFCSYLSLASLLETLATASCQDQGARTPGLSLVVLTSAVVWLTRRLASVVWTSCPKWPP